jgi:hypothetical protein
MWTPKKAHFSAAAFCATRTVSVHGVLLRFILFNMYRDVLHNTPSPPTHTSQQASKGDQRNRCAPPLSPPPTPRAYPLTPLSLVYLPSPLPPSHPPLPLSCAKGFTCCCKRCVAQEHFDRASNRWLPDPSSLEVAPAKPTGAEDQGRGA